jgi:hypothetical protein
LKSSRDEKRSMRRKVVRWTKGMGMRGRRGKKWKVTCLLHIKMKCNNIHTKIIYIIAFHFFCVENKHIYRDIKTN